jgi:succinate-semialdehyde dehydrogenase/glutarate-semialdehyde dehydrogenase
MSSSTPLLHTSSVINGRWEKSEKTFQVTNPSSGEVIAEVADMDTTHITSAVRAADEAWKSWRQTTAEHRSALLWDWFRAIKDHREELARIMTQESGKPLKESRGEVDYGASFVSWYAEEARRAYGETIPSPNAANRIVTLRQGVGVVAAITPWNFPLAMITRKVAPALAAGCTVVLRPASQTPLTALALARLAEEAGIPAGVFNVVAGTDSGGMGKELSSHPLVRKLTFTGSTEVGRILMEQAAGTIKKVSFELGGNAPFLVFDDADLDQAVEGAITAKFRNSGQTCVAANRFLVQDSIFDAFAEKLVTAVARLRTGDGMEEDVQVGPLINQHGLEKVEKHIEDALEKGARLLHGGNKKGGLFFEPTVLADVSSDALIAGEETFGPLIALFRFSDEEEAVRMANATEYGLAAYFFSQNIQRCWRISEQIESGMVGINTGLVSTAPAPFGGIKQSGIGREGSRHGMEEFMEIKYLCFGGN